MGLKGIARQCYEAQIRFNRGIENTFSTVELIKDIVFEFDIPPSRSLSKRRL
jgi:hypothetical protein